VEIWVWTGGEHRVLLQRGDIGSGNSCKPNCGLWRQSSKKSAVYDWYTHLKMTSSYILSYDKHRRRPTTSKNDENVTEVRTTLTPDPRVTTETDSKWNCHLIRLDSEHSERCYCGVSLIFSDAPENDWTHQTGFAKCRPTDWWKTRKTCNLAFT